MTHALGLFALLGLFVRIVHLHVFAFVVNIVDVVLLLLLFALLRGRGHLLPLPGGLEVALEEVDAALFLQRVHPVTMRGDQQLQLHQRK